MKRDLERERDFVGSGAGGWAEHVHTRLAAGQEIHGDRWAERPLTALLYEILEEAADIGAWAALAEQRLDAADFDDDAKAMVRSCLSDAVGSGSWAHWYITLALKEIHGDA